MHLVPVVMNPPMSTTNQLIGHKTRSVFERYNIVSDGDLGDAAFKLDRHLVGQGDLDAPWLVGFSIVCSRRRAIQLPARPDRRSRAWVADRGSGK